MSVGGVSGDDVVAGAQRGETAAFTILVDTYHAELVRIAYVVCGDIDLALDAVQATWVTALRKLPTLRDPSRIRSWLVAIAANEARQAARSRRRRALHEVPLPVVEPAWQGPHGERIDIQRALARLDPADRQLLALRYVAGFTSDEIGRAVGLSGAGVRTRLARLAGKLREDLTRA